MSEWGRGDGWLICSNLLRCLSAILVETIFVLFSLQPKRQPKAVARVSLVWETLRRMKRIRRTTWLRLWWLRNRTTPRLLLRLRMLPSRGVWTWGKHQRLSRWKPFLYQKVNVSTFTKFTLFFNSVPIQMHYKTILFYSTVLFNLLDSS